VRLPGGQASPAPAWQPIWMWSAAAAGSSGSGAGRRQPTVAAARRRGAPLGRRDDHSGGPAAGGWGLAGGRAGPGGDSRRCWGAAGARGAVAGRGCPRRAAAANARGGDAGGRTGAGGRGPAAGSESELTKFDRAGARVGSPAPLGRRHAEPVPGPVAARAIWRLDLELTQARARAPAWPVTVCTAMITGMNMSHANGAHCDTWPSPNQWLNGYGAALCRAPPSHRRGTFYAILTSGLTASCSVSFGCNNALCI
jgi:hypothetical protein